MLDRLARLPTPQREAMGTAFGLSTGQAPDRFLVGLAVLHLLSDVAEERPLVCIIDDAQWIDRTSAQILACSLRTSSSSSRKAHPDIDWATWKASNFPLV